MKNDLSFELCKRIQDMTASLELKLNHLKETVKEKHEEEKASDSMLVQYADEQEIGEFQQERDDDQD